MRPGGGREKGFQFERMIAVQLGLWWCGDKRSLWRNTNSGARATVVGKVYGGDIIPVNASAGKWPLCVEVKKDESWSFDAFIHRNPGNSLLSFLLQCLYASSLGCNNIPLLICARNRKKPVCMLHKNPKTSNLVSLKHPPIICRLSWPWEIPKSLFKKYPTNIKPNFYVLSLDAFMRYFSRKDFVR